MKIGVLALQGAIEEHIAIVKKAGENLDLQIEVIRVLYPEDLEIIDGLVMPGGESTTMTLMGGKNGTLEGVRKILQKDVPIFGTCAGAILLSKNVKRNEKTEIMEGVFPQLDVNILRNGYGRQIDSFSTKMEISGLEAPFEGIFIRAPRFEQVEDTVEILARVRGDPVLVKQGNILAATFHPELTTDTRIHELFLKMVREKINSQSK